MQCIYLAAVFQVHTQHVVQELPGYLMAGWTRCMNVLVSCEYQDGSAAWVGKSLAMCFGAIVGIIQGAEVCQWCH